MLVLSRRENQKVLFPSLGITVEVVGLKGNNVRLGIDAPPEIRVLRCELADEEAELDYKRDQTDAARAHERNNQLNSIGLQIQIAQKLLSSGQQERAMSALEGSLAKLSALEDRTKSAIGSTTKNTKARQTNRKALLVEDDANERQLMATILEMCGFEVDTVEDGAAAIEYLRSHKRPDCVLMDMQMPRMSGSEAIAQIRQMSEYHNLPIYGVSGLPRKEAKVEIGDRGVSGWFAKPVDASSLVRQIFKDAADCDPKHQSSLN